MSILVLDIGGTSIKSGLWHEGKLINLKECPSQASQGGEFAVKNGIALAEQYPQTYSKIGIASAGQINPTTGEVSYANPNIPNYTGTKLKEIFSKRFNVPVVVENDGNAAALGELMVDRKDNPLPDNFVCLTYGTGIGGAVVIGNKLYTGYTGSAGELGGIITHGSVLNADHNLRQGWYESYASTTALVKKAVEIDPTLNNGRIIFENLDNPQVSALIDSWILEIIIGLVTIIHTYNPGTVLLGGGIMKQEYIINKISEILPSYLAPPFRNTVIQGAQGGNNAGLLGMVRLAQETKEN